MKNVLARWLGRHPDSRCRCGHTREAHTHYRTGTDCAVCGPTLCARFRPDRSLR